MPSNPLPDHSISALGDPVEAWKARGRELNAFYDVLRPAVHDEESQGDALADLRHLVAERDRLRAENERLREFAEDMAAALDLFRQCAEGTVSDEAIDAANAAFDAWAEYPAYRSLESDDLQDGGS